MSEYVKDFVPYTTPDGRKRLVNMARVVDLGEATDSSGTNVLKDGGTELIFGPDCWITAKEPMEHFMGRRSTTVGHR